MHYYMVYIAYFTELNSKNWDYAQKWRICRENCKYTPDEKFHGHFCPRRKPAKSCHPELYTTMLSKNYILIQANVSVLVCGQALKFNHTQMTQISKCHFRTNDVGHTVKLQTSKDLPSAAETGESEGESDI